MYHHRDPTRTVPLFLHKNSLRMRANRIVHHVSPVMEDDVPVRLSSQSQVRLLDRRFGGAGITQVWNKVGQVVTH